MGRWAKHKRDIIGAGILFAFFGSAFCADNLVGPFSGLNNADNSVVIPAENAQDLLNVDLSLGGKSVKKRDGYGLAYALSITTSPVHGTYVFYDATGNNIALAFNDTRLTASINNGSATVLFSTGPNGATYQCTDSQGFAYCVNTSRNNIIKTNGVTVSSVVPLSTGTIITVTPTRLVSAGFLEAPNRVDYSAAADFTSWATGVSPTSAFSFTITAPGSKITHLTYAFNRVMWFKDNSFGYILEGATAADWVVQTISPSIGTLDNTSVYDKGILYFRAQDSHIYSYDGSTLVKLTRDIGGTVNISQRRASNFWTQTSQSDFQAGATSPGGWIDTATIAGAMFLTTGPATSSFIDSVSTDFVSGTLTNTSTFTANSLCLSFNPQFLASSFYPGLDDGTCSNLCTAPYYQTKRIPGSSITRGVFSSFLMRLKKTGSPGSFSVTLAIDNGGGLPGTVLETVSFLSSAVGTSIGDLVVNFSSTSVLSTGTTYWVTLAPLGACDSSNKIEWYGTGGVGGVPSSGCGSSLVDGFPAYAYKFFTTSYTASGNIVSRSFDQGVSTTNWLWSWSNFYASGTIPSGTTLTYETQTASATTGPFNTLVSVSSGNVPASSVQQFIRYKASFATTSGSTSPVLNDVQIYNGDKRRPAGTFYSAVKNSPSLTSWDNFNATILNNGGTQTFYIRSSTNSIAVGSSTPTWTTIIPGAVPSISTGTYFQIRDDFVITYSTQNPNFFDFTQNWFEGSALDKSYSTYFKDAIWFSVAVGTSATINNRILRYDLINQTWLLYDLPVNGFYVTGTDLYFGSSNGGYVYKFGDSGSDNGSAINSYWRSKDFFNDSPFTDDDVTSLSTFFSVNNSSMTLTYYVNGSTSTSYTIPTYRINASFGKNNRNLPQGTSGNTFSIKFGNNASEQPWEMFGVQYGTTQKSWKPGE